MRSHTPLVVFLVCFQLASFDLTGFNLQTAEADLPSKPLAESGEKLYQQFCASCHGQNGKGNGPASLALRKTPSNLRQISKRRKGQFPVPEILEYIDGRSIPSSHGSREMPVWGRTFSAKVGGGSIGEEVASGEMSALVEYLRSIQE